jgi:hypothetical protein
MFKCWLLMLSFKSHNQKLTTTFMMARFSAVMLLIFLCCCECWDDETDGVGSVIPRLLYQISHALRECRVLSSIPAASARSKQESCKKVI